ncbi:integrin beta-like protein 1 isoform X1 [Gouania willdenowi]|uniref:Integrin beta-like protein 1 n=2 Tax=Gouania willdenowi TaxID=441366 RepID=A0A8C5G6F0_GOUWI|nr:integrin beta-like protein 1 isoform X1 [Gouania willdenowi]
MHSQILLHSVIAPLFLILLSAVGDTWLQAVSQVGGVCKLSSESSSRRCRTPDGKICSGRGTCDCGICICDAKGPGKFLGPRCECHDWVCGTYNGKTCNDRGFCDCGMCECDDGWFGDVCQFQEECNLPRKKSKELCKNQQGVVCSNRGTCHCGSCMCKNEHIRGLVLVTGRFCECDDSECLDEDTGEVCGGHGQCYCGNCYCAAGWHGDKCEFQCDISPWESKRRCTSPDGKICSNRGTCVCGECTCYDVDPSGDWGDIHGDTCECDERICHATYDRYTDDFCSGHGQCNCGRCDCKEGWVGKKCEHPSSCSMTLDSSLRKCRGTSNLPCFGRGQCLCGQCTCHPPGDSRVHGKNCECDDRQCEDISGQVCSGHGYCSCGRCICEVGWFGKQCQFKRSCDMSETQSKEMCETSDGVVCSGKGSCHCGQCICSPQDWWVSGEYCECDDRECDKHDGLVCTGNGFCNCGTCECWDGWTGNACEIWVGTDY